MAKMHAARLSESDRLRRIHDLLLDGRERSTREIVEGARVMAASSAIAELRENGCEIECRREGRVWLYRMTKGAEDEFPGGGPVGVRVTGRGGTIVHRTGQRLALGRHYQMKSYAFREARLLNEKFRGRES